MNAKTGVVNDAFISLAENMNAIDVAARLLIALISLGAILTAPPVHYMNILVLAAIYAFTTAVICWDPLYALFGFSKNSEEATLADALFHSSITDGVGSHGYHAANDSQHAGQNLRKAG